MKSTSFPLSACLLLAQSNIGVSGFLSSSFPTSRHAPSLIHDATRCPSPPLIPRSSSTSQLFSTSARDKKDSAITGDDADSDNDYESSLGMDLEALLEGEDANTKIGDDDFDELELLAAIDETPVGELTIDQAKFMRDIMAYFVAEASHDNTNNQKEEEEDSSAPIVEKLLFRLLDEWQAVIAEDTPDNDNEDYQDRVLVMEPTIEDFTVALKAWEQEALRYSKSRRKDKRGHEALGQVSNLMEILEQLWEEAGIDALKPNQEVLEIVLRVYANSRERGADRKVWDMFESVSERYGLDKSCEMYQSAILALARSKDRGSSQRAEKILQEAVEEFPPHRDSLTGEPRGIRIETFNKVLVSWAKSGLDYGPERAEKLLVYMDELDRDLNCSGLVVPNLSSFTTLIDAYAQQNDWDGVSQSERIFNRVLDLYLDGETKEEPNIASWTIVLAAWQRLAKKHRYGAEEKADRLLKRMESLYEDDRISFGPDAIAYVTVLNAWAYSKNQFGPTHAEMILDEMHERYMDGDDSMRPSPRSVQAVMDSWIKVGSEETMEQAELLFDRYEEHLESLEGPSDASSEIEDMYKSMLVGWSRCNPKKAQEYLSDMIEREMEVDSFCFDKIIDANTHKMPDDPNAMKRVTETIGMLEKCNQAGKVTPSERVYTSFIRALTKARTKNLAAKSNAVLQRMKDQYEAGNRAIRPSVFTYNAVLNACAVTPEAYPEEDKAATMEAFKIAIGVFNEMRGQRDGLDHVSFGNMMKCAALVPEGAQKEKFIESTFKLCCEKGFLNPFVVRDLQNSASEELWRSLLRCPRGEVNIDRLPPEWSKTASAKSRKAQENNERGMKRGAPGGDNRRSFLRTVPPQLAIAFFALSQNEQPSSAEEVLEPPSAALVGDAKKLFNEGRVFESQGNMAAAQRLYSKVTKIEPRFVYGWSNLGNTQVAVGDLAPAEVSYTTAIDLCKENIARIEKGFGVRRCDDLSVLLLNRGSLRLNNGMQKEALEDLESSSVLRGRPDAVILQNLARAREVNGYYSQSDRDYNLAISMTANEVNPFWLRSALVKLQLGDIQGGFDLLKRVENRFPEAPEVRAAYATFLAARGDQTAAQQKYLEIPDRQREKFTQNDYLKKVVTWPPKAIETLGKVSSAVGDKRS